MWNTNFFCNTRSQTAFILQRTIPAKYVVPPALGTLVMHVNTLHLKEIKHIYSILVKHICAANPKAGTVSNYVENVLKVNPTATPASFQSTAIISAISQRKS